VLLCAYAAGAMFAPTEDAPPKGKRSQNFAWPKGRRSNSFRLKRIDGRTREAKMMAATRAELIAHVGGPDRVTAPQSILIERIAIDLMRLRLLDNEMASGSFTEHDGRVAHALRNSLRLALRDLGIPMAAQSEQPITTLHRHLRRKGG
jgi:hypothetical protein